MFREYGVLLRYLGFERGFHIGNKFQEIMEAILQVIFTYLSLASYHGIAILALEVAEYVRVLFILFEIQLHMLNSHILFIVNFF